MKNGQREREANKCSNKPEIPFDEIIYIVLVRTNYQVHINPLTEMQFVFLQRLINGNTVRKALEQLVRLFKLIPEKVAEQWLEWKKEWILRGFFLEK